MKGLKHFIVRIPEKFSKTMKTESGVEIHLDRRHSPKLVMNNVVDVLEVPMEYTGNIKVGDTLLLDPVVLLWTSYIKGGERENKNLIDRDKKLFKIEPNLIIMYRPKGGEWIGHQDNVLLDKIPSNKKEMVSSLLIANQAIQDKFEKNKGIIAYSNEELLSQGVGQGETVHTKGDLFVDIRFNDKNYLWSKTKYLIAVELKEAV